MGLQADRLAALDRLLERLRAVPPAERPAWVDALQGDDAALAGPLRDLLAQPGLLDDEDRSADAWTQPLRAAMVEALDAGSPFHAGQSVGPYRLLRPLGEGGMGVVWLAERSDGTLRRQVALKLPRPGLHAWRIGERFERERDILGSLEHPHIARLYEAGFSPDGQPFLAMEFVMGRPITEHADAAGLDVPARLRLFLQVLAAVQHAHQRLVVHRDLKPSNILVDTEGRVRLLDFGIAQLQDERIPQTVLTEVGQAVLTPRYASPEQVAQAPVSTASDVYSLGVVLCELLSGQGPYATLRDTRAALEDAILQGDLQRPSQLAPPVRRAALRGDLDNVVRKALQLDPALRYASVDAFAQDLQRHLDGVPVLAHPDSLAYRARKFVRRNRLAASAVGAVTLALLVGLGAALWQAGVARAQAARAGHEAQRARAVQQFLVGLFDAADPARAQGREPTVRDLMTRAEADLPRLSGDEETMGAVRGALVDILTRLGEDKRALALAQSQLDEARSRHGPASPQAGRAQLALGHVHAGLIDHDAALEAFRAAQRLLPAHQLDDSTGSSIEEAIAHELIGLNRVDEAVQLLKDALPDLQARLGPASWSVLGAQAELAVGLAKISRQTEALALAATLEPQLLRVDPAHAVDAAFVRSNIASLYWRAGRWPEAQGALEHAIAEFDRLQGPDNDNTQESLLTLAAVQRDSGAPRRAAQTCAEALRRSERALGPENGSTRVRRSFCVPPLLLTGRVAEGLALARRAAGGPAMPPAGQRFVERMLGLAELMGGDAALGAQKLSAVDADEERKPLGPNPHAGTLLYLSAASRLAGDAANAARSAERALSLWSGRDAFDHRVNAGRARLQLALALAAQGALDPAEAALAQARQQLQAELPAAHPALQAAELVRAALLRARGQEAAASALERETRQRLQHEGGIVLPPGLPLLP